MKDAADRGTDSVITMQPSLRLQNHVKGRPSSRSKLGSRIPSRINLRPMQMRRALLAVKAVAGKASRGKEKMGMGVSPM